MNRQAIAPVIAVTLLLVTAVLSAVFFQTWFQTFQSGLLIDVESQSQGNNFRIGIEDLLGEKLFVNAGDGLNITKISIDGNDCNFTGVVLGVRGINVSDCINNLSTNTPSVIVVTNGGVISEKVFVRDEFVGGEETGSSFTPTSCYNPINVGTIGVEFPCTDMLIVNRSMLDFAIANNPINGGEDFYLEYNGTNYTFGDSTYNIFTGQVTDMTSLFGSQSNFNVSIDYWDVSNVTDMFAMFSGASSFNSDLSSWNVSSVVNMMGMFSGTSSFTSDLSSWDVSNVRYMNFMFWNAHNFTSNLSNWDVSNVVNLDSIFGFASSFSSDLSNWDVSNVFTMSYMFYFASSFSSDLSSWNVSNVNNMERMFSYASNFNSDLSSWNVSKVTDMGFMFSDAISFNQDISSWDVSNVSDMDWMFKNASSFNQNLSSWCVPLILFKPGAFDFFTPAWNPKIGRQPQWNTSC